MRFYCFITRRRVAVPRPSLFTLRHRTRRARQSRRRESCALQPGQPRTSSTNQKKIRISRRTSCLAMAGTPPTTPRPRIGVHRPIRHTEGPPAAPRLFLSRRPSHDFYRILPGRRSSHPRHLRPRRGLVRRDVRNEGTTAGDYIKGNNPRD